MASFVFELGKLKETFLGKIDKLPSAEKAAITIAWNLVLAKGIISLTGLKTKLTINKTRDSIANSIKKVKQTSLSSVTQAVKDNVKNPIQGTVLNGFKDPSIDVLKKTVSSVDESATKKSIMATNLVNKSSANIEQAGNKIDEITKSISNLESLKI